MEQLYKVFCPELREVGLKKLISTSYAHNSKNYQGVYQPTLFETSAPYYDQVKTVQNGKIFTLSHDRTGDHKINVDDLEWHYLAASADLNRGASLLAILGLPSTAQISSPTQFDANYVLIIGQDYQPCFNPANMAP